MTQNVDKSLSWIYDPSSGDPKSEDFLLGKAVDANFERGTLGQINAVEYDCTPESIFSSRAEHQVDLQRKLQEDPLLALKKRELDTRRKLLDNPIKMKQLQDYIEKSKKSKKKKSKKKHKKRNRSSSASDDSDLDKALLKKLQKKMAERSSESESEYEEKKSHKKQRKKSISKSPSPARMSNERQKGHQSRQEKSRSKSRSVERRIGPMMPDKNDYKGKQWGLIKRHRSNSRDRKVDAESSKDRIKSTSRKSRSRTPDRKQNSSRKSRSRTPDRKKNSSRKSRSRSVERRKDGSRRDRSRSGDRRKDGSRRDRSRSPINSKTDKGRLSNDRKFTKPAKPSNLKEDEKEKKLREMMENAKWRDQQRTKNVHKYRSEDKVEESEHLGRAHDPEFIRRQLSKAAEFSSVESRIQSNKQNIQRSDSNMEKNFAKR